MNLFTILAWGNQVHRDQCNNVKGGCTSIEYRFYDSMIIVTKKKFIQPIEFPSARAAGGGATAAEGSTPEYPIHQSQLVSRGPG